MFFTLKWFIFIMLYANTYRVEELLNAYVLSVL